MVPTVVAAEAVHTVPVVLVPSAETALGAAITVGRAAPLVVRTAAAVAAAPIRVPLADRIPDPLRVVVDRVSNQPSRAHDMAAVVAVDRLTVMRLLALAVVAVGVAADRLRTGKTVLRVLVAAVVAGVFTRGSPPPAGGVAVVWLWSVSSPLRPASVRQQPRRTRQEALVTESSRSRPRDRATGTCHQA